MNWNEFGKIESREKLDEYFDKNRPYGHGEYCYYTTKEIVNSILDKKQFWVGNVGNFNDKKDAEQFGKKTRLFYGLCFSTGVNENLSLWYMYSGMSGKGARIRLSKTYIKKLVKNSTYRLVEIEGDSEGKKVNEVDYSLVLKEGETMKSNFKDVLYFKENADGETVDLKYNTMTNHGLKLEEYNQYKNTNNGFNKGLIWYYEKETRLLIELCGEAAKIVENNPDKKFVVLLTFNDTVYKNLNIDFAPEIEDINCAIAANDAIQRFIFDTSRVRLSEYSGTLEMNLCKRCAKKSST